MLLDKGGHADRREPQIRHAAATDAAIEHIVDEAKRKCGDLADVSDASRIGAIRGNRAEEKQINRQSELFRLGVPAAHGAAPTGKVLPFPTPSKAEETDYSLPSIAEIVGDSDDD